MSAVLTTVHHIPDNRLTSHIGRGKPTRKELLTRFCEHACRKTGDLVESLRKKDSVVSCGIATDFVPVDCW